MNLKCFFLVAYLTLTFNAVSSQNLAKDVLFTIDEKPYYIDDFRYFYSKNLDLIPESERDVKSYLDSYIDYKLKVAKAKEMSLDTVVAFKRELKVNRDQLVLKYLSDETIIEQLTQEAYERSLQEINASHILFFTDLNASAQDTLQAYQKAIAVRDQILLGGISFEEMAKEYSDDPSAKINGGNLGYFSVFKMVYPFETGAYKTEKGSISMPIRTQFGYHLIKVNDRRQARGELSIAHLVLLKPYGGTIQQDKEVEDKINSIYTQLQNGADFATLVQLYSEDKLSKNNGGEIQRFAPGGLGNQVLEDAAYALYFSNEISKPIETDYSWHIIRLIEKHPLPVFDKVKDLYKIRVKRDSRSMVINEKLIDQLKERFDLYENKELVSNLKNYLTDDIFSNSWKKPVNFKDETLFIIDENHEIKLSDFFGYVEGNQIKLREHKSIERAAEFAYEQFVNTELKNYFIDNLEEFDSEFKFLVTEYEEGLLIFDLMKKEIWDKARVDTLGYKNFYVQNAENYFKPTTAQALIFEISNNKQAVKVLRLLQKGKTKNEIIESFSPKETNHWRIKERDLTENSEDWIPNRDLTVGIHEKSSSYVHTIIQIKKIYPKVGLTFEEVENKVIYDYQEFYEKKWMEELKASANIKLNTEAINRLEKEI